MYCGVRVKMKSKQLVKIVMRDLKRNEEISQYFDEISEINKLAWMATEMEERIQLVSKQEYGVQQVDEQFQSQLYCFQKQWREYVFRSILIEGKSIGDSPNVVFEHMYVDLNTEDSISIKNQKLRKLSRKINDLLVELDARKNILEIRLKEK